MLNLNVISEKKLEEAIDSIGKNAVVLIEDIDSFKATNKREDTSKKKKEQILSSLTLSGILNAIDGISDSDGRILVITTNKLKSLDDALIRPGRVDLLMELGYLNEITARKALERFFPKMKVTNFKLKENLSPAQLQNIVMQFKDNPQRVLENISLSEVAEGIAEK